MLSYIFVEFRPGNVVVIAEGTAGDRETFYVTITGDAQSDLTSTSETTTTTTTTTTETTTTTTVSLAPGSVTGIELTFYAVSLKVVERQHGLPKTAGSTASSSVTPRISPTLRAISMSRGIYAIWARKLPKKFTRAA